MVGIIPVGAAPAVIADHIADCSHVAASDALTLAEAEAGAPPGEAGFALARTFLDETPEPASPVGGRDIVALGVAPGPRIGQILDTFRTLWAEAGCPPDAAIVERLVRIALGDACVS